MSVVQLRQKGVASSPLGRVQGLGAPDPEVVEASGQGLWVEASEGASGEEAVEGGGCFRVFRGRLGWMLVVGWSREDAQG